MNFRDARDLAIEFGCKLPRFNHTSPIAQCWVDRIAMVKSVAQQDTCDLHRLGAA